MTQAADVLNHFQTHVFYKFRVIQWVYRTGEYKILPDQDAVTIAQIVKTLLLVETATPNAQHVLVRLCCITNESFQISIRDSGRERIRRDPIGAFGENGYPVDHEGEGTSPFICLLAQFDGA